MKAVLLQYLKLLLEYLKPFLEYLQFNTKFAAIMGIAVLTTLKRFVFEFVFDDVKFLVGIGLLFITYCISGSVKALIKGEFRLHLLLSKTGIKMSSYALFILVVSIVIKLKVQGNKAEWVQWLDDYLFMGVALHLLFLTVKNIVVINPELLPPKLAKWFAEAEESGTLTKPNL